METKGLGAGSYPEPIELEERTIKVKVCFDGYVSVPVNWSYEKVEEYVKNLSIDELSSETDSVVIDDIQF